MVPALTHQHQERPDKGNGLKEKEQNGFDLIDFDNEENKFIFLLRF
jgi:hypothetical protein